MLLLGSRYLSSRFIIINKELGLNTMSALMKKNRSQLQQYDVNQGQLVQVTPGQMAPQLAIADRELKLYDIISILKRRKWSIIIPLLLTLVAVLFYTFSTPPSYRANAMIQIERDGVEIVNFGQTARAGGSFELDKDPFFRTRYEILKSRVLAQKVIDGLNLKSSLAPPSKDKSSFSLSGIVEQLGLLKLLGEKNKSENSPSSLDPIDYNEIFRDKLHIEPVGGTRLVKIAYEAPTAEQAKDVVSRLIDTFIKSLVDSKSETGEYAKNFLSKKLAEAKERLMESEIALVKYAKKKGILGVDDRQTRHVTKLQNLDSALVQAGIRRIEAESLYQQMQQAGSVSTVLTNPVITSLKARLVTLEGDYQEMLKTFKPSYPDMQRLQQQINSSNTKLKSEMANIQRSMKADFLAAQNQEDQISTELGQLNRKLFNLQDSSLDYNTLKREVDTNGKLYKSLLQRFEEVNVASAVNTSTVSIIEPAITPIERYRPRPKLNMLLGLFSGLLLGLGFAFLREALDQSIKGSEDLERISGLPVLGMIPKVTKSSIKKQLALVSKKFPQSPAAEAYRIVATHLRLMLGAEDERVMLITSVNPQDGKSVTATNIACAYAQMGHKVLLVDADIRNASLHEKLSISNKLGLSNYLKGEIDLVGITQPVKKIQGLYAITAGNYHVDPVSLLSHERMSYLTTQGATIFDYVIIDAPPVSGFADALVLSSLSSATLLVAQEGDLDAKNIQYTLKQLGRVTNNVLGFLLVKVNKSKLDTKFYKKYSKKRSEQALLAGDKVEYA